MEQSRLSVQECFNHHIKVTPYILNINGENEWVEDYVKFGDLIEEHMGKDARDFYFEQVYELLSLAENPDLVQFVPQKKPDSDKPKKKTEKVSGKRLF